VFDQAPIRQITVADPADTLRRGQVPKLAEQMLPLHQRLSAAKTPQKRTDLKRSPPLTRNSTALSITLTA
jgi:hypothetical protein